MHRHAPGTARLAGSLSRQAALTLWVPAFGRASRPTAPGRLRLPTTVGFGAVNPRSLYRLRRCRDGCGSRLWFLVGKAKHGTLRHCSPLGCWVCAACRAAVAQRILRCWVVECLGGRARRPTNCGPVAGVRLKLEAGRHRASLAHDKGVGMIEPTLRDRLTAVYETWLDQDDFGQRYVEVCGPEQDNGVTSVRQFLEELLRLSSGPNAHIERPAALEHPDSTFMQLLGSPLVTQDGPRGLVESVAHHALCLRAIPRLLFEAFGHQDQIENAVRTRAELPTAERGR